MYTTISKTEDAPAPEWLRVPEACRLSGLSRSTVYELIAEHAIKSSAVRRRHARRGVRLIHRASLLAFIESHAELPQHDGDQGMAMNGKGGRR